MPNTVPNATVSESNFSHIAIPLNTQPMYSCEFGHTDVDDCSFRTDEFNTSLKELMNRIYKLELDVYVLKQQLEHGGTISL